MVIVVAETVKVFHGAGDTLDVQHVDNGRVIANEVEFSDLAHLRGGEFRCKRRWEKLEDERVFWSGPVVVVRRLVPCALVVVYNPVLAKHICHRSGQTVVAREGRVFSTAKHSVWDIDVVRLVIGSGGFIGEDGCG